MSAPMRMATERDARQIQAIYAPFCEQTSSVSFEVVPPSVAEMSHRIAHTLEQFPWLVCEDEQKIIGYVYANVHSPRHAYQWSVSTSVYVLEQRRRSGIGRALYTSLLDVLRLQGYCNAYAGSTLPNSGSERLHKALGFEPVGIYHQVGFKGGSWHDVAWWQLQLQDRPSRPQPPRSLSDVIGTSEFDLAVANGASALRVPAPG